MAVGEAEVDKAVGERLFPALVHLLRNAVDHAIERPEARRAAGKPPEATIRIAAAHRGDGELELAVSDDGRGIDLAAVARKAGTPLPTSSAEILDLIGRPGLSTMSAPSRTSGRGIGMDVVRRVVVTDLGGALHVSTSPAGTTFTLRVPVSLTIVDGLTFACAGETYVVPTAAVDELVEIEPEQLISTPAPRRGGASVRMLRWRAETVPFFELGEVLGLGSAGTARKAIILKRDGTTVGFGVDRMLGRQEVVIRAVRDPLVGRAGLAGATDLGDGKPTLVLDLAALARTLPATPQEKR
jgi:two-component system chemotaxis sensor kinase CheA